MIALNLWPQDIRMGREFNNGKGWHRSKEDLETLGVKLGIPFMGYITNKKWVFNEEFNKLMVDFQQVKNKDTFECNTSRTFLCHSSGWINNSSSALSWMGVGRRCQDNEHGKHFPRWADTYTEHPSGSLIKLCVIKVGTLVHRRLLDKYVFQFHAGTTCLCEQRSFRLFQERENCSSSFVVYNGYLCVIVWSA